MSTTRVREIGPVPIDQYLLAFFLSVREAIHLAFSRLSRAASHILKDASVELEM